MAPVIRARMAAHLSELLLWDGRAIEAHSGDRPARSTSSARRAAPAAPGRARDLRAVMAIDRPAAGRRSRASAASAAGARGGGRTAGSATADLDACWRRQRPVLRVTGANSRRGPRSRTLLAEEPAARRSSATRPRPRVRRRGQRAEALIADIRADARARGSIEAHLAALTWGSLLAFARRPRRSGVGRADHARSSPSGTRCSGRGSGRPRSSCTRWSSAMSSKRPTGARRGRIESAIGSAAAPARAARPRPLASRAGPPVGGDRRPARDRRRLIVDNPSYVPGAPARAGTGPRGPRPGPGAGRRRAGACPGARTAARHRRRAARARDPRRRRGRSRAAGGGVRGLCELTGPASSWRAPSATSGSARRRAGKRSAAREPLREALELARAV